jgi:hypothetical protein
MDHRHRAWWKMVRYMQIEVRANLLLIRRTQPNPRICNFALWISNHIWYIFQNPPIHLRFQAFSYVVPLRDPRFALLFANQSRFGMTNIAYNSEWTLVPMNFMYSIPIRTAATTSTYSLFSLLTDEMLTANSIRHIVVDVGEPYH